MHVINVTCRAYHGHSKPLMGLSTYKMKEEKEGETGIPPNPQAWIVSLQLSYRVNEVHTTCVHPQYYVNTHLFIVVHGYFTMPCRVHTLFCVGIVCFTLQYLKTCKLYCILQDACESIREIGWK